MSLDLESDPHSTELPLVRRLSAGQMLAARMVPPYVMLIVVGALVFRFSDAIEPGQELGITRCIFTSINAATLTGFDQEIHFNQKSPTGKTTLFALMLGGLLFTLIVGALAVRRIAKTALSDRQIVVGAFVVTALATLVGALGIVDRGRYHSESLFLGLSAFSNCGLYFGQLPSMDDGGLHAVLLPLALAGGLGLTVLLEIYDWVCGSRFLSRHTRTVLTTTALLYLVFFAIIFVAQWLTFRQSHLPWRSAMLFGSVYAINARGAGFPLDIASPLAIATQWSIIALMILGGNPGGAAGGLKPTALLEIFGGLRAKLRGLPVSPAVRIACTWVLIYASLVALGYLLLLSFLPEMRSGQIFFLSVSAVSNIGLSRESIIIGGHALTVLSGLMLAGRIVPLLILWWMVRAAPDAEVAVA